MARKLLGPQPMSRLLREYREDIELSLEDVADAVGVSKVYLSQLESGTKIRPSFQVIASMMRIYGAPMETLLKRGPAKPDLVDRLCAILKTISTTREVEDLTATVTKQLKRHMEEGDLKELIVKEGPSDLRKPSKENRTDIDEDS